MLPARIFMAWMGKTFAVLLVCLVFSVFSVLWCFWVVRLVGSVVRLTALIIFVCSVELGYFANGLVLSRYVLLS